MINLLKVEFYKQIKTKYFWISNILYIIFLISIPYYINYFLNDSEQVYSKEGELIKRTAASVYYTNMWKTLIITYSLGTLFMFFTIISSITREYKYKTVKQNIIDGLSKKDFFLSKLFLIIFISIFYTLLVGIIIYFSVGKNSISSFEMFLLAHYLLFLLNFLLFVFFISFLFKSFSSSLFFTFSYLLIIEPIISFFVATKLNEELILYFPLNSLYRILAFDKVLNNTSLFVSIFYCFFYAVLAFIIFNKRDL